MHTFQFIGAYSAIFKCISAYTFINALVHKHFTIKFMPTF